ncbi:hypothetical protein ACKTEK_03200 [Tepidamorphus sp. 3E244]|uniref:hypothetical protein n=1 Tax=Tepidamorphus sp. 3E244 TaxID=3385498 RepID=UPI0038FC426C
MKELNDLLDAWPIIDFRPPPGFEPQASGSETLTPVAPAPAAAKKSASSDDHDALSGMTFGISYRDHAGEQSRRTITCERAMDSPDGTVILAHCHLREAILAFPLEGIEAITDYRTGETLGDPAGLLAAFGAGTSETPLGQLIERTRASVRMLVHCANADGEFADAERDVILDFIADAAARAPVIQGVSRDHLSRWINALNPTAEQLARDVAHVSGNAEEIARLTKAMSHLIVADGDLADSEVLEMRKLLDAVKAR